MKIKSKGYLKVLLIGYVLLSLTNCEKDYNQITEVQKETKIKHISFDTFSESFRDNTAYDALQPYLDFNRLTEQSIQSRNLDASSQITVLTDIVTSITEDNMVYYTFKVITDDTSENKFYNLIISANTQNEIVDSKFLQYTPSTQWLSDTNQPFTGYLKLIQNDFLSVDSLIASRGAQWCVTSVSGQWECNYGENHAPRRRYAVLGMGLLHYANLRWMSTRKRGAG